MKHKSSVFFAALVVSLIALAPLTHGQKPGTSSVVPLRVTVEHKTSDSTAAGLPAHLRHVFRSWVRTQRLVEVKRHRVLPR